MYRNSTRRKSLVHVSDTALPYMRLGLYNHLAKNEPYFITEELRTTLAIGKPRAGKTTLLCNAALDDIADGRNVAFIDMDGVGFETMLSHIPEKRQKDVLIYDASDTENCFGLNILNAVPLQDHSVLISTLLAALKSVWDMSDVSIANINQYVRALLDTLLKAKSKTLLHMIRLLLDEKKRDGTLNAIDSNLHNWFWEVFSEKDAKQRYAETTSTMNKLWEWVFEPQIRNVLIQKHNHLCFKDKIVLVKLPVSEIGLENARFLGAIVLSQLSMDARAGNLEVYLDECYILGSSLLDRIISTFPQYGVSLTMSLAYLDQFDRKFIPSLVGGIGTLVAMRTSVKDTQFLKEEYELHVKYVFRQGRIRNLCR